MERTPAPLAATTVGSIVIPGQNVPDSAVTLTYYSVTRVAAGLVRAPSLRLVGNPRVNACRPPLQPVLREVAHHGRQEVMTGPRISGTDGDLDLSAVCSASDQVGSVRPGCRG